MTFIFLHSMSPMENMIKNHGLRVTEQRLQLVTIFQKADKALNYKELSALLPKSFDRVTIYRNLKSFEEKGLVHAIPNADGDLHYALCRHHGSKEHSHHESHAHFHCSNCHKIECLDGKINFHPEIPSGYQVDNFRLMLNGLCDSCT